jgi:hypothetical protein
MRSWRAVGFGVAALVLGSTTVTGPVPAGRARPAAPAAAAGAKAVTRPAADSAASISSHGSTSPAASSRPCAAFPGAHQLPGADGVTPAAWSGGGLVVPACGPDPGDGSADGAGPGATVYPYPGALWTAGYQCVEFSERYLYDRYGLTMNVVTNGDQVAANYASDFPGLFMIITNGTPRRPPAAGDVLSLSAAPGFDSAAGGHTAVVQSSAVDATGNGTVTVVEENAVVAGIARLTVAGWTVRYPGYPYIEWLTATRPPGPPPARPGSPPAPVTRPAR